MGPCFSIKLLDSDANGILIVERQNLSANDNSRVGGRCVTNLHYNCKYILNQETRLN